MNPLFLLADSQLLFQSGEQSLSQRVRAEFSGEVKAAYIGASNNDRPEFYQIFTAAMERMGITACRMVPAHPSPEDRIFLEAAGLVLLAGGDAELGWTIFEQNGINQILARKRYDGSILIGVSAGAIQLGLGALSSAPQPKKIEMFRFAPFYLSAHNEKNEWWDLRAIINLSSAGTRGIGIPAGGGAIYWPNGMLEPLSRPLTELVKEEEQVRERLILPE